MARMQDPRLLVLAGFALLILGFINITRQPSPLKCENTYNKHGIDNTSRLVQVKSNVDKKEIQSIDKINDELINKLYVQLKTRAEQLKGEVRDKPLRKSPDIKLNKCPKEYTFSKYRFSRFNQLEQKSNYSLSGKKSSRFKFNQTITILTPVYNGENHLQYYFSLLCHLSYPHELISIALGEDSSSDNSYEAASSIAKTLQPYFRKVSVFHFDTVFKRPKTLKHRHDEAYQLPRRSHMAKSRNQLLYKGIGDSDFVLWIDLDVKYYPHDIIQHLLSEDKDVLAPTCQWATGTHITPYDWNNWQESPNSIHVLSNLPEDTLRVEGYGKDIKRHYLHDLYYHGHIVPLDGVGGCLLMVRAKCHREGLFFPTFIFKHQIETEGLAKMAKSMGFGVYGLPSITVIHTYN